MQTLTCSVEVPRKLLATASSTWERVRSLHPPGPNGSFLLRIEKPAAWRLKMNRGATSIGMSMSANGCLYELSEIDESVSGGWMGSCMPSALVVIFLRHWIAQSNSSSTALGPQYRQPSLFD